MSTHSEVDLVSHAFLAISDENDIARRSEEPMMNGLSKHFLYPRNLNVDSPPTVNVINTLSHPASYPSYRTTPISLRIIFAPRQTERPNPLLHLPSQLHDIFDLISLAHKVQKRLDAARVLLSLSLRLFPSLLI